METGQLTRFEDWPLRLTAFVEGATHTPFAWGRHDCCLFAADAVAAITGVDPASELRGRYHNPNSAARLSVRRGGFEKMVADLAARHGMAALRPLQAQRGDVMLVDTEAGPALGVCLGGKIACAAPLGLSWLPLTAARRAWRVG
jgi:hypothetical protein